MNSPSQPDRKQLERSRNGAPAGEEGFMLLAVVVMVALLLIALSVAAPVVARQLQREKEIESQHRMNEYVRAIRLYQRKFPGQYPASIKILENTNNVRFLRHVYVDPLTNKADYKLIHQGEQKTKIHVFFGQELEGLAASLGSAAGLQSGGGGGGGLGGAATNVTSTNALNSGFGGATIGGSSGTSGLGTTGTSGTNGTTGTNGSSSLDSLGTDSLGVIVGVGTSKSGTSITQPNGQTTYESWEFWYDPRIELLRRNVNVTGGGVSSQSASSFGQNGVTGQPNSGGTNSTTGSNGAFGNNGTTGTTGTNGTNGTNNPNNPF
jgi:type II secretory pathway pseudopilin PulG